MNETLCYLFGIKLTAWKLVGYLGIAMFGGRWLVQMWYSRKAGKSVIPRAFWLMSLCGCLLCLLYFIFGKNDSVGILAYITPLGVAGYNLYLDITHAKRKREEISSHETLDHCTGAQ
jgi:lipid-A-disaccharide synthase-like uncharacterized protein